MPLEPMFEIDLEGKTPVPRGNLIAAVVFAAVIVALVVALHFLLPRESPVPVAVTSRLDAVEARMQDVRTQQEQLTAEQTRLREEMRQGFERIQKALGRK